MHVSLMVINRITLDFHVDDSAMQTAGDLAYLPIQINVSPLVEIQQLLHCIINIAILDAGYELLCSFS
jgi:hypothetical protein